MNRTQRTLVTLALIAATGCGVPPWSRYDIATGAHVASVVNPDPNQGPRAGFESVATRNYDIKLNPSFIYVLTNPVQPEDQFDWNKFPGLSDCSNLDLAVNGAMFVWRWRTDLTPNVLELAAYANNNGVHLNSATMATFTADQLAALPIVNMQFTVAAGQYEFTMSGATITTTSVTLPRACAGAPEVQTRWASGLYFGGTSTAPSPVYAEVREYR